MPPISNLHYLGRRDLLVVCWNHVQVIYSAVPSEAQSDLHGLYAPNRTLTDDEFLVHMRLAVEGAPSLPQRAGKHYKKIFDIFKCHADVIGKTQWELIRERVVRELIIARRDPSRSGKRHPVVIPIDRSDVDVELLARALIELERRDEAA